MTKRPDEIALMAESGKLLANVFGYIDRMNLIGIQFAPIDSERQNILRHIGMLNLAPPSLLNRKLPALFQAWRS